MSDNERNLSPELYDEIKRAADVRAPYTEGGIHVNYGDAEDRYAADTDQQTALAERLADEVEAWVRQEYPHKDLLLLHTESIDLGSRLIDVFIEFGWYQQLTAAIPAHLEQRDNAIQRAIKADKEE